MNEHVPTLARAESPAFGLNDSIYNRLLRERIIWLGSEVRDDNANAICAQMLLLAAEDPDKDIWLYINSPGGSITAGMAIYDTMQFIQPDVATIAMGMAASMGQFLLSSGAQGKRYATPHARVMMHQPSGGIGGTATDVRINAQLILHMKTVLAELTAAQTGKASTRSTATPTATAGSRPPRPSSTASSTTWSSGPTRSPVAAAPTEPSRPAPRADAAFTILRRIS